MPALQLLDSALLQRILDEAFGLLMDPGVRVQAPDAVALLAAHGAEVESEIARIPRPLVEKALATAPHQFWLYDRAGRPVVQYGGDAVHFDPGSSGVNVLDAATGKYRPSTSADLVRLIQVAEMLPGVLGAIHGGRLLRRPIGDRRPVPTPPGPLVLRQANRDRRIHGVG